MEGLREIKCGDIKNAVDNYDKEYELQNANYKKGTSDFYEDFKGVTTGILFWKREKTKSEILRTHLGSVFRGDNSYDSIQEKMLALRYMNNYVEGCVYKAEQFCNVKYRLKASCVTLKRFIRHSYNKADVVLLDCELSEFVGIFSTKTPISLNEG